MIQTATPVAIQDIPFLVLKTPKSDRFSPLADSLSKHAGIKVTYLDSVMADSWEDLKNRKIEYNLHVLKLLEGRTLLPREAACAASHNLARVVISNSLYGGVILEDDARIIDIFKLTSRVIDFLKLNSGEKSILNLTPFYDNKNRKESSKIVNLLGQPNLAVAYALTNKAAKELLLANDPIRFTADWPISNCSFFVLSDPLVIHGDEKTKSVILNGERDFRLNKNLAAKISRMLLFPYFSKSNRGGITIKNYLSYVISRRIFLRIDKIRIARL